jgi:hypothetical protein
MDGQDIILHFILIKDLPISIQKFSLKDLIVKFIVKIVKYYLSSSKIVKYLFSIIKKIVNIKK